MKGESFQLESVDALDHIYQLKQSISEKTGVDPTSQRLLIGGKALLDYRCLLDYQVKDSCTISLFVQQVAAQSGTAAQEPVLPQPVPIAEVKQNNEEPIDMDVFWAKIRTVLDSRFTSEVSMAILSDWKQSIAKYQ